MPLHVYFILFSYLFSSDLLISIPIWAPLCKQHSCALFVVAMGRDGTYKWCVDGQSNLSR